MAYCWRNWHTSPALLIKEGDRGDVLVVLDDVTDYQQVKPYLPPTDLRFKVLITTQLQLGKPIKRLDLEVLTEDAALKMLRSYIGDERVDSQLEVAKKLCKWLGYLPHPNVATSLHNLAELYRLQGRYKEAEPLLKLRSCTIYNKH